VSNEKLLKGNNSDMKEGGGAERNIFSEILPERGGEGRALQEEGGCRGEGLEMI